MSEKLKKQQICKCGDANPDGNVSLTYKGGCMQTVVVGDAYRCTGCNGWFHKDCILKHFELEKKHDWGRKQERDQILKSLDVEVEAWMTVHEEKQKTFSTNQFIEHMRKFLEGGEQVG